MAVFIRYASADEWIKLVDIYRHEGLHDDAELVAAHNRLNFKEIDRNRFIYFAEVDGIVVGSLQLVFTHQLNPVLANGVDTGHVHHLRISKTFEGQGIASMLNHRLEADAVKKGFARLTLEVHRYNLRAISIYKHWGYEYLQDGYIEDEIIMSKYLYSLL